MIKLKTPLLVVFLLSIILGCSKEDTDTTLNGIYKSEDLKLIHNDSAKTWNLVGYYSRHPNTMHEQNDCYVDETYIFKPEGIVEVVPGSENCYYGDSETSEAHYTFYDESGQMFLTMARKRVSGDMVSNMFFSLPLMELDENRMLFAAGEKGDYGRTLIFESE